MKLRNIENQEREKILAAKKVFNTLRTKSFNKLEKIIESNPNHKDKQVIALFAYFHKDSKLNTIKHPNLIKLANEFKVAIDKAIEDDPYYKIYVDFVHLKNKKRLSKEFKHEAIKLINQNIKDANVSINLLSEKANLKYANVYNFLEKEVYSDLSIKSTYKLLMISVATKEGWETREETIINMLDKFETLKQYWEDEI